MSDLLKRIGTFKVTRDLIEMNPEGVIEVLKDILVVQIDNNFINNILTYKGYSKKFNLVEYGEEIPNYVVLAKFIDGVLNITWHIEKECTEKSGKAMFKEIRNMLDSKND